MHISDKQCPLRIQYFRCPIIKVDFKLSHLATQQYETQIRLCVLEITSTPGSFFGYYFLMSFFFRHVLYSFKNTSEMSVFCSLSQTGSREAGQALIHMCRGGCALRGSGAPPKRCGDVTDLRALLWRFIFPACFVFTSC